jgi:hypothetical protein
LQPLREAGGCVPPGGKVVDLNRLLSCFKRQGANGGI